MTATSSPSKNSTVRRALRLPHVIVACRVTIGGAGKASKVTCQVLGGQVRVGQNINAAAARRCTGHAVALSSTKFIRSQMQTISDESIGDELRGYILKARRPARHDFQRTVVENPYIVPKLPAIGNLGAISRTATEPKYRQRSHGRGTRASAPPQDGVPNDWQRIGSSDGPIMKTF